MIERLRTFYDDKALEYPEVDVTAQARCEKAIRIARVSPSMRVLDVACKDAVLLGELRRVGIDVSYVGIDLSERVIEKSRSLGWGGEFIVADVTAGTPFPDGSFDRVFALEIMEHLPDPARLLTEAHRLLSDDGRLILSVPNPYYYSEIVNEIRRLSDTDGHLFSFTQGNVRALLELHGFEIEATTGTYVLIPRTLRHPFRSSRFFVLKNVPELLARSRICVCRKA